MKKNKGFTLIEVLVVIGIFIVLTTVVLSVLITVLRGSKQSDSIILVRQNGEHAMNQMVKTMRFSGSLDYPRPLGGTPPVCSGSGITTQSVQVTSLTLIQDTFSCPSNFNYPNFIALNGTRLTNSNTVVVKSCSFVCTQPTGGPPTIGISFTLSKVNSSGLTEGNSSSSFQTSVTLRNISD